MPIASAARCDSRTRFSRGGSSTARTSPSSHAKRLDRLLTQDAPVGSPRHLRTRTLKAVPKSATPALGWISGQDCIPLRCRSAGRGGQGGAETKNDGHSAQLNIQSEMAPLGTCRKDPEGSEIWTRPTASSLARGVPEVCRVGPIRAARPSPRPHQQEGSVTLEAYWKSFLDNPAKDTELRPVALLAMLKGSGMLEDFTIYDRIEEYIEDFGGMGVGYRAFMVMLHYLAWLRHITYAELVGRLVFSFKSGSTSRLAMIFAEFAHGSARGLMTVFEFTCLCRRLSLFAPPQFVEGDIRHLFRNSHEGVAVDYRGFLRLLEIVAHKLDVPVPVLHRRVSELIEKQILRKERFSQGADPDSHGLVSPQRCDEQRRPGSARAHKTRRPGSAPLRLESAHKT